MKVRARARDTAARSSRLGEQTLLICCIIGAAQITWGAVVPALPLLAERFAAVGTAAVVLGPIIAAFGLGRAIANVPAGVVLRWWRPRPYLLLCALLLCATTALTGLIPGFAGLVAMRGLAGILGGAVVTIGFSVLVASAPANRRGRVMATATAVQMSAAAVGSLLGGLVLTWMPVEAVFAISVVPLALCLVWEMLRPAGHYLKPALERHLAGESGVVGKQEAKGHPGILLIVGLVLVSFAVFFARFGGEQGLIPILAYDSGRLSPLTLGICLAAATAVSLAAMPLTASALDRGARASVFVAGTLVAAAAMILVPLADGPVAFGAVVVLYGLAGSVAGVVPTVVMSDRVPPSSSGFVVGLTRTAGDVGAVLGPVVVLWVLDGAGGVVAALVVGALLVVFSVPLAVMMVMKRGRRSAVPRTASAPDSVWMSPGGAEGLRHAQADS